MTWFSEKNINLSDTSVDNESRTKSNLSLRANTTVYYTNTVQARAGILW